ncbi:TIGR03943 family protein [Paenibacillus sp. HJL G12]|uniref:TIGR03943 family protein n=1 Tax=Paenibacillus dendrobii TaxID=2691084 RepID=A0A7X3LHY2_9BACL|nr:TIGR03943 family protein [Paenibacillus dendrobii]MWV43744.1 TIGR03943 family protein [Paenibacillus dendrobii]
MKNWSEFAHRIIRALILSAFALFIMHAQRTDALVYFIAPRMMVWVNFLVIGMCVLAVHQWYLAVKNVLPGRKQEQASCACASHHHHHSKSALIAYGALAVPVMLTLIFPNQVLGSQMAAQKGLNLTPSSILLNTAGKGIEPQSGMNAEFPSNESTRPYANLAAEMIHKPVIPIPEDMYIESLTSLDLYRDRFAGKKVELKGYVYRMKGMAENQFAIGRFSMRCCVADTVPLAMMAELGDAKEWKDDMYVDAVGEIELRSFGGKSVPTIVIKSITEVADELPDNPYVYQNPYFGV